MSWCLEDDDVAKGLYMYTLDMYSYDKDIMGELYGVLNYGPDEVRLAVKNKHLEGYTIKDVDQVDPKKPSYIDDTKKILIDNAAPYGHIITCWIYLLLSELELSGL
jgi:hypothetical protein